LQEYLPIFKELGASAFGIVSQRPEKVRTFMAVRGLGLPILIDADRTITKRYGVYHPLGLDAFNTARPSTFLIDRDGRVRFIYVGKGQADRPSPETIVAELRKLN
jgi:peroxiredoxin